MKIMLIAAALMAAGPSARADGYKAMARDLASEAKAAGIGRVAVMPFQAFGGASERDGWNISEKLVTQLAKTGKVRTLERSMLARLFEEHSLGRAGAFDPATLRKLGKILSAEAVVAGSFTASGKDVMVNARLIDVETGVIIAASERRAERDWFDLPMTVEVPEFTVEAPEIRSEGELDAAENGVSLGAGGGFALAAEDRDLKDALIERPLEDRPLVPRDCDNAATSVDRLEARILDLKARYWAGKLKAGLSGRTLKVNPGSTISDPELKQEFYDKVKYWYARPSVPALNAAEVKLFIGVDRKAYELAQYCGI